MSDWTDWLKDNPPPSLQGLVAHYGGWPHIPAHAWAEYDRACVAWEEARKTRLLGSDTWREMGKAKPLRHKAGVKSTLVKVQNTRSTGLSTHRKENEP